MESWIRAKVNAKPSPNQVALKVTSAKTPQEAAKVYPGDYWLSLLEPPAKNLFPGTGDKSENNPNGNGLGTGMIDQDHWINTLKSGCNFCHQLGESAEPRRDSTFRRQAGTGEDPRRTHGNGAWASESAAPTCTGH